MFRNVGIQKVTVNEVDQPQSTMVDLIDCGLGPENVVIRAMHPNTVLRIQTAGKAWRITSTGTTPVPTFA